MATPDAALLAGATDRITRVLAGPGDRIDRIYDWCCSTSSQNTARRGFTYVRNFALFAQAEDPAHEVPPVGVFGRGKRLFSHAAFVTRALAVQWAEEERKAMESTDNN